MRVLLPEVFNGERVVWEASPRGTNRWRQGIEDVENVSMHGSPAPRPRRELSEESVQYEDNDSE